MSVPAVIVAGPLLVTPRSATFVTVVVEVDELLFVSGSLGERAMLAVFETEGGIGFVVMCAVSVNCALCVLRSSGTVQVTVPDVPMGGVAHEAAGPLFCWSETKVRLLFSASLHCTSPPSGPLFVTVIVKGMSLPDGAVAGALFTMEKSLD